MSGHGYYIALAGRDDLPRYVGLFDTEREAWAELRELSAAGRNVIGMGLMQFVPNHMLEPQTE